MHPNGRFLSASNRGNSTITVFRVDPATGRLSLAEFEKTGMESPWNIDIDPTGTFCLAPDINGSTITVFRIDQETGVLHMVGSAVPVPSPVCIRFLR